MNNIECNITCILGCHFLFLGDVTAKLLHVDANIYGHCQKKRFLLNILHKLFRAWKGGAPKHDHTPAAIVCHCAFKFGCCGLASDHQGLFNEDVCTRNCTSISRVVHFVQNLCAMELCHIVEYEIEVMICVCQTRWVVQWELVRTRNPEGSSIQHKIRWRRNNKTNCSSRGPWLVGIQPANHHPLKASLGAQLGSICL